LTEAARAAWAKLKQPTSGQASADRREHQQAQSGMWGPNGCGRAFSLKAGDATECFACGRSFTYRGHSGDDCGRFCSTVCRDAFDAGEAPYERPDIELRRFVAVPLEEWAVIAGPPGTVGTCPWAAIPTTSLRDRQRAAKKKVRDVERSSSAKIVKNNAMMARACSGAER
jgi:hypothetical protein